MGLRTKILSLDKVIKMVKVEIVIARFVYAMCRQSGVQNHFSGPDEMSCKSGKYFSILVKHDAKREGHFCYSISGVNSEEL